MIGNERMKKQRLINAIDNSQIYQIGDKWLIGREYEIVDVGIVVLTQHG